MEKGKSETGVTVIMPNFFSGCLAGCSTEKWNIVTTKPMPVSYTHLTLPTK
jgi:hypothetical protein